jgi:hypothetical protein
MLKIKISEKIFENLKLGPEFESLIHWTMAYMPLQPHIPFQAER